MKSTNTPESVIPAKTILCIAIGIQLAMLGLVGLSALGYDVPILRPLTGFIFLTFVPGVLILIIVKIRNLNIVKTLVYSVGLSIAFVMFTGFFMNAVFPYLGVTTPISILPVMSTLIAFTAILSFIAYKRDRDFLLSEMVCTDTTIPISTSLFLVLIPILAALGTLVVTSYQNNTLLLIVIPIIALIPAMIAFDKFIPPRLYPLAVFSIALALLYHYTLVSPYIVGWDIHTEYYFQGIVMANSHWDYSLFPGNVNAMLSIVMLCPIYSLILDINSVWVFKLIYPFIFALVPLSLYEIYRGQFGAKRAFLSVFFFMATFTFFTEMMGLARQQIAELFYVLLILLIVDKKVTSLQKSFFAIIFIASLPVSHYGLAYILAFIFALSWLLLGFIESKTASNRSSANPDTQDSSLRPTPPLLKGTFVCIFLVFILFWYMYISVGPFYTIIRVGDSLYSNLSEFFAPESMQGLTAAAIGRDWTLVSPLGQVFRFIHYCTEFFVVVGVITSIVKPQKLRLNAEFFALTVLSFFILLMCIFLPFFSSYLNVSRFYHLALFLLAPFFIIGFESLWLWATKAYNSVSIRLRDKKAIKTYYTKSNSDRLSQAVLILILILYFLFNTGFILEISKCTYVPGDTPGSIVLGYNRQDGTYYNWQECTAVNWISDVTEDKANIYADTYGQLLLRGKFLQQARGLRFDQKAIYISDPGT